MKTTLGWIPALLLLAVGSCYNPNIVNGGLRCAEAGEPRCPEGFVCHPTGRCYKPDTGPTDCGSTQLCAELPMMNQECNLACQTGCGCGQRCNVTKNGPRCVAMGTKALGQSCMLTNGGEAGYDDCAPGLVCLREQCGGLNRCYRLCSNDTQCGKPADDLHCRIPVVTANPQVTFTACDVPRQDCDPIAKTGCPAGLTCFLLNNGQTLCDCPTNSTGLPDAKAGLEGAACALYSDCKGGLNCVTADNASTCRPICSPSKATCAMGTTCKMLGTKYGVCSP